VGETYPHNLRARVDFEEINELEWAKRQDPPQINLDKKAETVPPAPAKEQPLVEHHQRGALIAPAGQPLHERQLELLRLEHQAFVAAQTSGHRWGRGVALFIIFSMFGLLIVLYVRRFQKALAQNLSMIAGVCVLTLLTVAWALWLHQPPWHALYLPLTMTAMVLTLVYNPQFALLMSFCLSLIMTVILGLSVDHHLQLMAGLAAAILLLHHVRTRTHLVQVALGAGAAFAVMTIAAESLSGQTWELVLADAFRGFLCGSLAGFLLTGLLPVVERCFGIITDISLLELADGSHPLLQELVKRAPGTYTHSMTVATLAEAAAETIGANPLLVRVGSYFHDIGKMLKPHYFIENQVGTNRHDQLEPALSTLVIIGHVKDGLALAEQYRLPRPIYDFIAQHHGTTLVEYFYREAMRVQEANGQSHADLETCFRYPGPKPQNRENGLLMLADAVESTSRSLTHPNPASLGKLVHDLLMKRLLDGQFEESGLTLTELHLVEESLTKSLIALFHARIKYPEEEPGVAKAG
jgi:hypothetical protein